MPRKKAEDAAVSMPPAPEEQVSIATPSPKAVRKQLDPHTVVTVTNGFPGKLVYASKKTGEVFSWESFGDVQDMELTELKSAKNANKAFFQHNWFLIGDPEVISHLGVEQYYKHALTYSEFDSLFSLDVGEIKSRIGKLSREQKRSVAYRAKQLIAAGAIDSRSVINTLEENLGVELIEK